MLGCFIMHGGFTKIKVFLAFRLLMIKATGYVYVFAEI